MTTFMSRPRALAIAALATAFLAPAAALAYKIVCQGSYLVYKCNDGTIFACTTTDDAGNMYQIDCVAGSGGDHACEGHGGFVGLTPAPVKGVFVADYKGRLPLEGLAGDGKINSTCGATMIAVCKSGETFRCDDERVPCPKSYDEVDEWCAPWGGVESVDTYIAFRR